MGSERVGAKRHHTAQARQRELPVQANLEARNQLVAQAIANYEGLVQRASAARTLGLIGAPPSAETKEAAIKADQRNVKEHIKAFDTNKDGSVKKSELKATGEKAVDEFVRYLKSFGFEISPEQAAKMKAEFVDSLMKRFDEIDANKDESVNEEELLANVMAGDQKQAEEHIATLDTDKDGSVSLEEYQTALDDQAKSYFEFLRGMGVEISEEEAASLKKQWVDSMVEGFRGSDANTDSKVSVDELKAAFSIQRIAASGYRA